MKKYVIGRVKAKPGLREEYLKVGQDYVDTSRRDAGCIYYRQAPDGEEPDLIIVAECWESPELHAAHTKQPHFAAFGPTFVKYVATATFEEMDVDDASVNTVALDFT